jgi:salicylate hydroxylase
MDQKILIVGGGIGGLAAALACGRTGAQVQLLEQSPAFGEVGAGIQLGPNVTRVLQSWGLAEALKGVAAFPSQLEVRNALSADLLGVLPLGSDMVDRYGAPYVTIARSDMHALLLKAVVKSGLTHLLLDAKVLAVTQSEIDVQVQLAHSPTVKQSTLHTDVLVGADGLWSKVRTEILRTTPPRVSGHLAFRAMMPQEGLPSRLRSQVVTAWMGPDFHVVQYPVRRGEWLNVVAIVHGEVQGDPSSWDHSANAPEIQAKLASAHPDLLDLVHAVPHWRLWPLCDRPPMSSAAQHARGRVALLGDAAHPMRPYLAQGAGMAIEDSAELARVLALPGLDAAKALKIYATNRWQRNARVQARAIRNGEIFHMKGPMRLGRDLSLKLLGKRLLDVPWLYKGPSP